MKYTERIKRCAEMLALKAEYPTDVVLGVYTKEYTRFRTDWSLVGKHFSGADESMAWRKLSGSLALQQKHTEELLRNQNLWDNCESSPKTILLCQALTSTRGCAPRA